MDEKKELLIQARFEEKRNWLKARKILSNGLKKSPESAELALELAKLYSKRKQYRRAISVCQNTLLYTDNEELLITIANCFLSMREYHVAVSYYKRIKRKSPELFYNRAVALARTKQFDEAVKYARYVLDYDVKSAVPHILLGELYFNKKEFNTAVKCCNQAEAIGGLSSEICFLRGMCWLAQQNYLKAYWDFHKGEIFKMRNPEYYRSYGIVCEGIGKTDKAIELLQEAIKIAPERPGAYLELIRVFLKHNMLDAAGELLQAARSSLPEDFPLAMMYNRIIDRLTEGHQ